MRLTTKSADDTRELGAAVASIVRPGDVILLGGDLGAGKTTFTQGFGRGLGVDEPILSPTFTIMHNYRGRIGIVHVDVYRLEHLQEVIDLGITELIDGDGVALVEWGEAAEPVLPEDFLEIRIEYGDGDEERHFELRAVGGSWSTRTAALALAVDRWRQDG